MMGTSSIRRSATKAHRDEPVMRVASQRPAFLSQPQALALAFLTDWKHCRPGLPGSFRLPEHPSFSSAIPWQLALSSGGAGIVDFPPRSGSPALLVERN